MDHEEDDPGERMYSEERNLFRERAKFISMGIATILLVLLIVYSGSLHSPHMALLAFFLTGFLLYPAILAVLLGFMGIRNLAVFEKGFIPPYCANPSINLKTHGFIFWKEVAAIYANKNLRVSRIFPFLVVKMREGSFSIPTDQIINFNLFLSSVGPYTEVIRKEEFRIGLNPITYYPPSHEARLDDDAIVLSYGDHEERFPFDEIRKVRIKMSYQLVMKDGKRIGLLGMTREDVQRIRDIHRKGTGHAGIEGGLNKLQGLLSSSSDEDEGLDD